MVETSISGFTAPTCIPNRMCSPRISDVPSAAPNAPASKSCVLLTLDCAEAHRRIKIHPDDGGLISCPESIVLRSYIELSSASFRLLLGPGCWFAHACPTQNCARAAQYVDLCR